MKIIRSKLLPPRNYNAINLFGILFCRPGVQVTPALINHERIHTRQMLEMGILFFYLWYLIEWLIRLPMKGRAYTNLSFEREAYQNMYDMNYLERRKLFAWTKYLKRKSMR